MVVAALAMKKKDAAIKNNEFFTFIEPKNIIFLNLMREKNGTMRGAFAAELDKKKNLSGVLSLPVFERQALRHCSSCNCQKENRTGRKTVSDETIACVKEYFQCNDKGSGREVSVEHQLSSVVVHCILKGKK